MANLDTIHIVPTDGGEWAVQAQGTEPSSLHSTQGQAVARAWEMVGSRTVAEVIVHGRDGVIHSNLIVSRRNSSTEEAEFLDQAGEEALRRAAMSITPSWAELQALIERLPPSSIDYSREDDELPC